MKKSFSQRMGLKPAKKIQLRSMDQELRNRLWNSLHIYYFRRLEFFLSFDFDEASDDLARELWGEFFKLTFDVFPGSGSNYILQVKKHFDSLEWNEVYDLIEFVAEFSPYLQTQSDFADECNRVLESEVSGYRLMCDRISPITNETEIDSIENAIEESPDPVAQHLSRSLELFADRMEPDYPNSIKESISAVESLCRQISGNPKLTLGRAIDEIKRQGKLDLHPALVESFKNLYGWTSDAGGIRHGNTNGTNADQEDARFMLVTCSAIVNFLIVKADKAGIDLR